VVRQRRPLKKGGPPVPRPSTGGLAIGFTAEELQAQAAKRAAWFEADVKEHNAIRSEVEARNARSSNRALVFVLVLWVVAIGIIFLNVGSTVLRGFQQEDRFKEEPASTRLFNAFRAEMNRNSNNR